MTNWEVFRLKYKYKHRKNISLQNEMVMILTENTFTRCVDCTARTSSMNYQFLLVSGSDINILSSAVIKLKKYTLKSVFTTVFCYFFSALDIMML